MTESMHGVIVIDKPVGMSSAQVVAAVKRLLRAKKVGHTGTLDPFASGVLVCCINQATRLSQFFMEGKKSYEGVMHLGVRTDTQDATGRVQTKTDSLDVSFEQIERVFQQIAHRKSQSPPVFSALKYKGTPLYRLARKGIFVQKPSRPIMIHRLALGDIDLPRVRFEVCCGHGTYVRTLCSDIGEALGCGAHLAELRRTESGNFSLADSVSLEMLTALSEKKRAVEYIIPMNEALKEIPEVRVDDGLAQWIRHGNPMSEEKLGVLAVGDNLWVKVTDGKNLIAVVGAKEKNGNLPYKCVFSETATMGAY
jgi:tRNA pseudouridine55 synthase